MGSPDEEALVVRYPDDLRHRVAVVGEVVLREGVEHAAVATLGQIGHVPPHMPRDPHSEVRASRSDCLHSSALYCAGCEAERDSTLDEEEEDHYRDRDQC